MNYVAEQAIIGLCSIALQHIMDENYDKAQDTLLGLIISIEGGKTMSDDIDLCECHGDDLWKQEVYADGRGHCKWCHKLMPKFSGVNR